MTNRLDGLGGGFLGRFQGGTAAQLLEINSDTRPQPDVQSSYAAISSLQWLRLLSRQPLQAQSKCGRVLRTCLANPEHLSELESELLPRTMTTNLAANIQVTNARGAG